MRKFKFSIVVLVVLSLVGCSKNKERTAFDICKEYSQTNQGIYLPIPPTMVAMLIDDGMVGGAELKKLLRSVDKLSVLMIPASSQQCDTHFNNLEELLVNARFSNLTKVNRTHERVQVMGNIKDAEHGQVSVLAHNYDTFVCINFVGPLKLEDITQLTQEENLALISILEKLKGKI